MFKRNYLRTLCNTRIAPSHNNLTFHEAFLHTMYVKMQAIKTSNLCFAQIAKIEIDRKMNYLLFYKLVYIDFIFSIRDHLFSTRHLYDSIFSIEKNI